MTFLYSALSGLLLGISYNYPSLWFIGLFAFIPFLYALYSDGTTTKAALLHGLVLGLVFFGSSLFWFWHMFPLDRLGVESPYVGAVLVFIQWGLLVGFMTIFVVMWAFFAHKLKLNRMRNLFLVPLLWVVFEYLSLWGYAVLSLGGESLFSPQFSMGMLGYILAGNHNLLQIASIGGVYLLSFVVVFINVCLFWLSFVAKFDSKRGNFIKSISIGLLVLVAYVPFGELVSAKELSGGEKMKIALLNTYIPSSAHLSQKDVTDRFNIYKTLVSSIKESGESPDIVVLPEDSRFLNRLMMKNEDRNFFNDIFGEREVFVIDSGRINDEYGDVYSHLILYSSKVGVLSTYDKTFLSQMGEYTPYLARGFFKLFGLDGVLKKLDENRSYSKGKEFKTVQYKDLKIGALFCSEIMSPSMYRTLAGDGAGLFVNLSSQSLAHGSKLLYRQTVNMAKVRAVESNKYFAQASNFVPSFIIDNNGRFIESSDWGEGSVLYGEVEINANNKSFYTGLFSSLK